METSISIVNISIIIISVLSIGALLLAFSSHFGFPFTIALVLAGIGLTNIHEYAPENIQIIFQSDISPNLILCICLPALIFESVFNLHVKELKSNIMAILFLAIPGLLISTFIIGTITHYLTGISFAYSLLLGSILSATDPVAVISIFKKLGAPKKLTILIEGESLFNDATSIVTSKIILSVILSGTFTTHHILSGVEHFLIEFLGGLIVGTIVAYVIGWILSKVEHNREIEISLTIILAYGSFIIAQEIFHVSGVTSTVAAGLILGTWGYTKISPEIITFNTKFWEFLAYSANALIFLIVGISVKVSSLITNFWSIVIVIIAISISRLFVIYGLVPLINKFPGQPNINIRYQTIMYWGGLRGAIALAIILSINKFEYSELFTTIILGIVLYTLLVQGLTIEKLVKYLSLDKLSIPEKFSRLQAIFIAKKKSISAVDEMQEMGMLSINTANSVYTKYYKELDDITNKLNKLKTGKFTLDDEKIYLFKRCFSVERTFCYSMFAKGHFANITYNRLIYRIDEQISYISKSSNLNNPEYKFVLNKGGSLKIIIKNINKLKILTRLSNYLNAKYIALNYKFAWGSYHGAKNALLHIKEIRANKNFSDSAVDDVYHYFDKYHYEAKKYLLSITSQFPEFVTHMQSRLAERILLSAEINCLNEQIISGTLPEELAQDLKIQKYDQITKRRERPEKIVHINNKDHFKKINIFKNLPNFELDLIKKSSEERIINIDSLVIAQNDKSDYIFFITSGIVDIIHNKNNFQHHVASLLTGNYFSTNDNESSRYDYKTTTPCTIICFKKKDLNEILDSCPNLKDNLATSQDKRKNLFEIDKTRHSD